MAIDSRRSLLASLQLLNIRTPIVLCNDPPTCPAIDITPGPGTGTSLGTFDRCVRGYQPGGKLGHSYLRPARHILDSCLLARRHHQNLPLCLRKHSSLGN